jgi:two-component system response regulator MtrA
MASPYAMVIEDDPQVSALFHKALHDAGFHTEVMENGHKAQASLMFTTPDLVVLDLHLPSLDGSILLRQIRSQMRLVHTRVIIVSGDEDGLRRVDGQADAILVKPIGYEQLRRMAEEFIPLSVYQSNV